MVEKLQGQNLRSKQGFSILVYSEAGAGKTTLLGSLPVGRVLILDVEGGLYVLEGTKHHYVTLKDDLSNLDEVYMKLKTNYKRGDEDYSQYNFIAIDSLTELYKWFQFYYLEKSGKKFFNKDIYGKAAQKLREYLRNFRNLTYLGKHIIFTALETSMDLSSDGASEVKKSYPYLSEGFTKEVSQLVDCVGHLEMKNIFKQERMIRLQDNGTFYAKSRIAGLDEFEPANLKQLFIKMLTWRQDKLDGKEETKKAQEA